MAYYAKDDGRSDTSAVKEVIVGEAGPAVLRSEVSDAPFQVWHS